jgi:hypothetical protein
MHTGCVTAAALQCFCLSHRMRGLQADQSIVPQIVKSKHHTWTISRWTWTMQARVPTSCAWAIFQNISQVPATLRPGQDAGCSSKLFVASCNLLSIYRGYQPTVLKLYRSIHKKSNTAVLCTHAIRTAKMIETVIEMATHIPKTLLSLLSGDNALRFI